MIMHMARYTILITINGAPLVLVMVQVLRQSVMLTCGYLPKEAGYRVRHFGGSVILLICMFHQRFLHLVNEAKKGYETFALCKSWKCIVKCRSNEKPIGVPSKEQLSKRKNQTMEKKYAMIRRGITPFHSFGRSKAYLGISVSKNLVYNRFIGDNINRT